MSRCRSAGCAFAAPKRSSTSERERRKDEDRCPVGGCSCALAPHLGDDVATCRAHLIQITELTLPGLLACLPRTRLRATHRHMRITRRSWWPTVCHMPSIVSSMSGMLMWMMPHIDAFAMIHTPGCDEALHHNADHNGQRPSGDQQATIAGRR